LKMLNGMKCYC